MVESSLKELFEKIFEVERVTFDDPSEVPEQGMLYIQIENAVNTIKDGAHIARVRGTAFLYGQSEKIPIGFFSKKIKEADSALTKDLFFYEIEDNAQRFRNLVQRGFSFVYFYRGEYDPENGQLTTVDIIEGDAP